jgi:2-polyprenyl-6-methoxyphenol hydroxylase-like FAD-dependent oxidoreductase
VGFHRGDFQAVFLNNVPDSVMIHTKKRLSSYTQDDFGVVLNFEDGSTAKADILIGADGLQSRVRRRLVEEVKSAPLITLNSIANNGR